MPIVIEKNSKFLNSREWRTFLSTAQTAAVSHPSFASHPSFMSAVRAGQAWLSKSAAQTCGWLSVDVPLGAGSQKSLGV